MTRRKRAATEQTALDSLVDTAVAMEREAAKGGSSDALGAAAANIAGIASAQMPIEAYTHIAPPPDPVTTIGTWQAEGIVIRRRDDNQAMLYQHIIEWLQHNPDAEISNVSAGRWERGREVTLHVWRRPATPPQEDA